MRRTSTAPLLLALVALLALGGSACQPTNGGGATSTTIGPEGGTLEVVDPSSPLLGLRITVPAGAFERPTRVAIEEVTRRLPALPTGVVGFEPAFRMTAGAPLADDAIVTLPFGTLPKPSGRIPTAMREESRAGTWSLLFPSAVGPDTIDVRLAEAGTYRWGFTILDEAESTTLETAMVERHGAAQWEEIRANAEQQYTTLVVPHLFDPASYTNCDKLNALGEFFLGAYDDATLRLANGLATSCNGCNISFETFLSELERWIKLQVEHFLVDAIVESCDVDFFIGLLLKFNIDVEYQELANDLSCDYQCLVASPPPGFWLDLGTIYLSSVSMLIVDLSRAQQGCPPRP